MELCIDLNVWRISRVHIEVCFTPMGYNANIKCVKDTVQINVTLVHQQLFAMELTESSMLKWYWSPKKKNYTKDFSRVLLIDYPNMSGWPLFPWSGHKMLKLEGTFPPLSQTLECGNQNESIHYRCVSSFHLHTFSEGKPTFSLSKWYTISLTNSFLPHHNNQNL